MAVKGFRHEKLMACCQINLNPQQSEAVFCGFLAAEASIPHALPMQTENDFKSSCFICSKMSLFNRESNINNNQRHFNRLSMDKSAYK